MNAARSHQLISTADAARALGCTVQHVRLLIRKGDIRGEKLGRDWLAESESVKAYSYLRRDRSRPLPLELHEPQIPLPYDAPEMKGLVNVASVPQRSPFRYPGGKTWLIPIARRWLGAYSDTPKLLVEPFAGGGGIGLMAAFERHVERVLLVELDPDIASVWRAMLSSQSSVLASRIIDFRCTVDEVRLALGQQAESDLDLAFLTILRNRVSRGGILAPGAGLVKNGEAGKGIASRWYPETLRERINAIHEQSERIDFREADGLTVLCEHCDEASAVFFIDPPYPVAGRRLYRFHDLDHRRLFATMARLRGRFLATYDDNPEVAGLAREFGFEVKRTPMKSTHHLKKFELLISRDLGWFSEAHG